MALSKKPTAEATAIMDGAFESEADSLPANAAESTSTPSTSNEAAEAAAGVAATTAIAKARTTAVAAPAGDVFGAHLPESIKAMLASVEFGELPRVIGTQGGLQIANEDVDLGRFVSGQILQVQDSFIASPGDDSEEAKKLVKYSKDGVLLDDTGEDVRSYISQLQADGWNDAALKHYMNVTVMLEQADDAEAAEDFLGTVVVIQMSPESRKRFKRYLINATMKASMKGSLEGLDRARFSAVKKAGNGRNWTEIDTGVEK